MAGEGTAAGGAMPGFVRIAGYAVTVLRLTCDNCDKLMEVPGSARGQKVKCPACGDIRVIPKTPPPEPGDRAAASGLPPMEGPERAVLRVRPAMFRARPVAFLLMVGLLVAGVAGASYYGLVSPKPAMLWISAAGAVLALVGLGLWKLRTMETSLEITTKRTVERRGLFSRHTSEVRHQDIRNIQVTQSLMERVLGVGRIGISSAGQDEIEIVADDIPNPHRVRETIDLYRAL